jgi:L-asparaginase II
MASPRRSAAVAAASSASTTATPEASDTPIGRGTTAAPPDPIASSPRADRATPALPARRPSRGAAAPPVLVEAARGDRVESRHRGAIAVCSPDGSLLAAVGDPESFIYLRSAAKPFQLAPFVASGLFDRYRLGDEALAIMAASHSGQDLHVDTVEAILRGAGLTPEALQCGIHEPYDEETARRLVRDSEGPTALRNNCSGKHAGMILWAKAAGWSIDDYWRPDHPVQQACLATVATLTDVARADIATATDGCGVVTFGVSLQAAATAFARLASPSALTDTALGEALDRIRTAMIAHPELVGASRQRLDTELMRAAGGALAAKGGAEGVQGVAVTAASSATRAPFGLALKIEDGNLGRRAGHAASCAALAQLGVLDEAALERLASFARPVIRDRPRGERSGEVRAVFRLD